MTNIICNLDNFVQYIHDSSAAIFSEERNRAHDWYKKISCGLNVDGRNYKISIKSTAAEGHRKAEHFFFIFEIELEASIDKNEARKLAQYIADEMQFHPNIQVQDISEYDGNERPTGNNRYFWTKPVDFVVEKDYCWDEIPAQANHWQATVCFTVKQTPCVDDEGIWGRSFDLNAEDALFPLGSWNENLSAKMQLVNAIRERDAKIAAEEARKRAEEEAEIARKRAEEEAEIAHKKAIEDNRRNNYEKFKSFVNEIADFEVLHVSEWICIGDLFKWNDEKCSYFDECGCEYTFRGDFKAELGNMEYNFIEWALEHDVREPQGCMV